MSDFRINAPNPTTIEFLQKEFIEKLSHELATNFSGNDDAVFLMENCRKATWLYYDSINRATISVDEYLAHANDFLTCCETLKKETADLIP